MQRFHRRRPSPALVVATVALVVASSGTAFASGSVAFIAKVVGLNSKQTRQVKSIADTQITDKSHVFTYDQTVNTTGSGGASGAGVVTLAKVGPFTIIGKCATYDGGSDARTYVRTTQANSAVVNSNSGGDTLVFGPTFDSADYQQGGQDVVGDDPIGPQSSGTSGSPSIEQSGDGPLSVVSGDGRTRLIIDPVVGNYLGGGSPSACTFYGWIIAS
jgi:hypothetical protein